ncbi:helix-turn-helix domain-containing protein [Haematospirillum jordaniae]|nr:helix-turn-helix domain-containing protein [Haematospirillum jordaniae]
MSFEGASMLIGYARVSTRDQTTELQTEALLAAGKLLETGTPARTVAESLGVSPATLYRWLPAQTD